ncbi:MAG: putative essential recombination function protein [Prokaryotic dsDNA virus sp.]|nr:MAG: putative essential recombination function protein [Prokaryotic dsDNA virus sp.]|tara:strand:+ start:14886 stop:15461 length:576 start_codon:yes stop_codon:yes gene_type:complete
MQKSESIKHIAAALNKAQAEMSGAKKGANNPFFKSKYADMNSVVDAVRIPFCNNGLSYSQFPIMQDNKVGVETILMHESGEWMSDILVLPMVKQDPQAAGSAITYAKRYALQSIAGIPSEDDDGNAASNQKQPAKQSSQNVNWYNNFENDKQFMLVDIQSGAKTADVIISELKTNGFAVSNQVADQIKQLR